MWTPELAFLDSYARALRGRMALSTTAESTDEDGQTAPYVVPEAQVFSMPDDDTLPASELAGRYGLDAVEVDILLFAAITRLDPSLRVGIAAVCAPLPVDVPTPLAWLRLAAIGAPARFWALQHYFGPERALRRSGLVELWPGLDAGADTLRGELVVPSDVLGLLRGDRCLDERLARYARRIEPFVELAQPSIPGEIARHLIEIVSGHVHRDDRAVHALMGTEPGDLVLVTGPRGVGKTAAVVAAAREVACAVIVLDGQLLASSHRDELRSCLQLAAREAELHGDVLLIDRGASLLDPLSIGAPVLLEALSRHRCLTFVTTRAANDLHDGVRSAALARVALPFPNHQAGREVWELSLEAYGITGPDAETLAEHFPLDGRQIVHAARLAALVGLGTSEPASTEQLGESAMEQLDDALGDLAVVQRSRLCLNDLIVPEKVQAQIGEILDAYRNRRRLYEEWGFGEQIHRGRGIICLLDGDPGTGKTLTAEVLAGELGLKLLRVNTGQIIDKYIGETEKRLADLFARTHPGLDLLLFDEADSLFGKRTKVERSTDRYANAAINVLLQLVEHYEGLVVLTTNLKQGIDPAFERRFSFKISYPMPEAAQREHIWRRLLPDTVPLGEAIDFEVLAEDLELSGGAIKNTVVRAGYLALREGNELTMEHLLESGYRELSSSGKLVRQDWEE